MGMKERTRIVIPIYEDEFEKVSAFLDTPIKDLSSRTIREAMDLKAVARRTGKHTEIRTAMNDKLKTMTEEQKEKFLEDLKK